MTDTTSELRKKIENAVMFAKTPNGEEDITQATDYIMELVAAQRQRWEAAARIEEVSLVPTLKTHRTTVDDVLIDLEVYKNNRKIELRAALDGELGKEQ